MQDACYASFNAVRSVFPNAIVLMCYFHVKTNIRKNLFSVLSELYDEFESNVTYLHYSTTEAKYQQRLEAFREKYKEQKEAMQYMESQWLNGVFSQWQIFCNNPGYANKQIRISNHSIQHLKETTLNTSNAPCCLHVIRFLNA